MRQNSPPPIRLHEDRERFREAVTYTAEVTKFSGRLIEKDYFCGVLLEYLVADDSLVFKGGTCLAKVHLNFCRLSEDLDFTIPMPVTASRGERGRRVEKFKRAMSSLPAAIPGFRIVESVRGANNSTQYIGVIGYESRMNPAEERIKIEVSLREPTLTPSSILPAKSILIEPVSDRPQMPAVPFPCLSLIEAFAEKFRAALTRREVAVRDFFDIDYAVRRGDLRPDRPELVKLVARKIAVPGNSPVDVSGPRLVELREQVERDLKPVLRSADFHAFDPDRAIRIVTSMAKRLVGG